MPVSVLQNRRLQSECHKSSAVPLELLFLTGAFAKQTNCTEQLNVSEARAITHPVCKHYNIAGKVREERKYLLLLFNGNY
jgi:hypothetical protein